MDNRNLLQNNPLKMPDAILEERNFLQKIPFLGWIITHICWLNKARPIIRDICDTLVKRDKPNSDIWGADLKTQEIAEIVCQIAKEEMGWPNDHFIPTDSARVVFWAHDDGLDADAAALKIGERLGVEVQSQEITLWFELSMSEVVELLRKRVAISLEDKENIWPPPPEQDF